VRAWIAELATGIAVMGLGLGELVLPCSTPVLGCPPAALGIVLLVLGLVLFLYATLPRVVPNLTLRWPITIGEGAAPTRPAFDVRARYSTLVSETDQLQQELQQFGSDPVARMYLSRVLARLHPLPVNFAKDFAGLLHAAYQAPFTEHRIVLTASGETGTIIVPDIDREITFPLETARNLHKLMEEMLQSARNDRTRDAGLAP
jgi:hypothetical protein